MKKLSILLTILVFASRFTSLCKAQQSSKCENTRMGKLIAKSYSNKNRHYNLTSQIGANINSLQIDTTTNFPNAGIFALKGDSIFMLQFEKIDGRNECHYLLLLYYNKRVLKRFHLDSNGGIDSEENSAMLPDKFERRKYQGDVDAFLKYF